MILKFLLNAQIIRWYLQKYWRISTKKKNPKILIVFDNIIADMISNKKQSNSNLIFLLEAEN